MGVVLVLGWEICVGIFGGYLSELFRYISILD